MTKFNEKLLITSPDHGECEINIAEVCKVWSKGFWISQYGDEYRLIRNRKRSSGTLLKVCISQDDALELIELKGLTRTQCSTFGSAGSWR